MSILSNNIIVFPTVKRTQYYQTSRYLNEQNIVSILKHTTDIHSYIISCNSNSTNQSNYDIEFVIEGYYFSVTDLDISALTGDVYADIQITDNELVGQDEGTVYTGLSITTTPSTDNGHYNLLLFHYVDGIFELADANKAKFDDTSIKDIHIIDCGEI